MPIAAYLAFIAANRKFIAFGFLMTLGSSFGQTYFIGIFGPEIQAEFDLSHTAWGTIYMIGTLASAALLPWTGKQIDRLDLRVYTTLACVFLIGACGFISLVNSTTMLVLAIFLLRQSGQGLMSHIGVTSMARYFDAERGRAIAIVTLGYALGEAVLPVLAVLAIAWVGWRWSYVGAALLLAVGIIPAALWLLKGHADRHRQHLSWLAERTRSGGDGGRSWTRAEVLRDARFYLLLPGVLAPAMVLTGMFFHHLTLADAKGWSHTWITSAYAAYAVATSFASLASGPLIDRFGATWLVRLLLLPLILAMIIISEFDNPWAVWPYMILGGINTGIAYTAVTALWAELYGVAHMGAVKSLTTALSVFATGLGPVTMGILMDFGISIERVCLAFAGYAALGAVLIVVALSPRMTPSNAVS